MSAKTKQKDYGTGRKCTMEDRCISLKSLGAVGKINRFTVPYLYDSTTGTTVLLCPTCDNDRRENDVEPEDYQGVMVKGRGRAYKLPNLKWYRQTSGYDQAELAGMSGCNRDTIRKLERGQVKASTPMLAKLAVALKVEPDDLRGIV